MHTFPTTPLRLSDWTQDEGRHPPRVPDGHREVLLREHVHHSLHRVRPACRALQRVPPLLHRQAEARRHRRPGRALRAPLRGPRRKEEEVADGERQQALRQAKLRALVKGRWGDAERRSEAFPGGAALVEDGVGWVLVEEDSQRALGRALLWAGKAEVEELHVLADNGAGMLARRASAFAKPPAVWRIEGTSLTEVEPDPVSEERPVDPRAAPLADLIRVAGAQPVVEHGVLRGEVLGLEVARV